MRAIYRKVPSIQIGSFRRCGRDHRHLSNTSASRSTYSAFQTYSIASRLCCFFSTLFSLPAQDFMSVLRHKLSQSRFPLCGWKSIVCVYFPVIIGININIRLSHIHHRFDRKDHARNHQHLPSTSGIISYHGSWNSRLHHVRQFHGQLYPLKMYGRGLPMSPKLMVYLIQVRHTLWSPGQAFSSQG